MHLGIFHISSYLKFSIFILFSILGRKHLVARMELDEQSKEKKDIHFTCMISSDLGVIFCAPFEIYFFNPKIEFLTPTKEFSEVNRCELNSSQ